MPQPDYTPEQRKAAIETVLDAVASGQSVQNTCEADGMPPRTSVMRWIREDDDTAARYARAREYGADALADNIISAGRDVLDGKIAPDQARVAIDAMKWAASKLKPTSYGERMEHRLSADAGLLGALQSIESRIKSAPALEALVVDVTPVENESANQAP